MEGQYSLNRLVRTVQTMTSRAVADVVNEPIV